MAIRYALSPYVLQEGEKVHRAVVQPAGTLDLEDMVDLIAQCGSTVGRADVRSVLEDLCSVVEQALLDGYYVATPFANFRISVEGTFHGPEDRFSPRRHRVVPRVIPGRRLRQAIEQRARVVKRGWAQPRPILEEYVDCNTGRTNEVLTPGGLGQIVGGLLKFDPTDPQQGISFCAFSPAGLPASFEEGVKVTIVGQNRPRRLIFVVPDLAPGTYQIEVRAAPRNCQEVRSGTLLTPLTVEEA